MSGTTLKENDYKKSAGRAVSRLEFKPNSVDRMRAVSPHDLDYVFKLSTRNLRGNRIIRDLYKHRPTGKLVYRQDPDDDLYVVWTG